MSATDPPHEPSVRRQRWDHWLADYGMIWVLLALMVVLSLLTIDDQQSSGAAAGRELAARINDRAEPCHVLIVTPEGKLDLELAAALQGGLEDRHVLVDSVQGGPREANLALQQAAASQTTIDVIACTRVARRWDPVANADAELLTPASFRWPNFLMPDNLVTIAQRITIIAIIAIGMTMVIITAGIDLSVDLLGKRQRFDDHENENQQHERKE